MSARLKAIDASLPQLIAVLGHSSGLLMPLSKACQECGILQGQPISELETKDEKILHFVHALWIELLSEDYKRKLFIQILKRYQAFRHVYKEIKRSTKEYKLEKKLCVPIEESGHAYACGLKSTMVTDHCSIPRLRSTVSEDQYHQEMDRNQYIAVINDLQDRMQSLEEERRSAQVEKESAFQKTSELEQKLDSVSDELASAEVERNTLECRNQLLQGKVAKLEKTRYVDSRKTEKKVKVFTQKINELEIEKERLRSDLDESRRQYQKHQEAFHLVKSIDLQYKWKLEKLTKKKEENEKQSAQKTVSAKFVLIAICFTIIIFIVLLIYFNFHPN